MWQKLHFNNKSASIIERFILSLLCATIFTFSFCHWLLDINYKYENVKQSGPIVDLRWIFVVCSLISLYYILKTSSIKFDFALTMLCQSLILIGVHDYHKQNYIDISYTWILAIAYILGKSFVLASEKTDRNNRIVVLYLTMALGLFFIATIDFFVTIYLTPIWGRLETEVWPFFWTGEYQSRCTMELGFLFVTAMVPFVIYKAAERPILLRFVLIMTVFILWADKIVQGRENLLLLPISLIIFVVLLMIDKYKALGTQAKTTIWIFFGLFLISIGAFIVAFRLNLFSLYDKYLASNWSASGGVFTNMRFGMDLRGFLAMLKYPLEDYQNYAGIDRPHSMILEYGRVYDLTVFCGLTVARIIMIKDAIVLAFQKRTNSWIKYLLIPSFVCVNLYYSMEPNGFAHRYFWMSGLLISGMIRGCIEEDNN